MALATTRFGFGNYQSSSGDNKQKEIKTRLGQNSVFPKFICIAFLYVAHLTLKTKIRSIRFEEFEEDFISVFLRIVYKLRFCSGWYRSGQTQSSKVFLKPTNQPAAIARSNRRQDKITYFFSTFKRSTHPLNTHKRNRSSPAGI